MVRLHPVWGPFPYPFLRLSILSLGTLSHPPYSPPFSLASWSWPAPILGLFPWLEDTFEILRFLYSFPLTSTDTEYMIHYRLQDTVNTY